MTQGNPTTIKSKTKFNESESGVNNMTNYDPRTISTKVYTNLKTVKDRTSESKDHDKQKSQAVELYTFVATWGLLRLAGEVPALSNERQKQAVVECFFKTLGELAFAGENPNPLLGTSRIETLTQANMTASDYLGLTGVGLKVAQEFSFWAEALYPKKAS
jgi:hypothetical protein